MVYSTVSPSHTLNKRLTHCLKNKNFANIFCLLFLLLFAYVVQSVTFIGFEGWNDDSRYVEAAIGWQEHFPFAGYNHWSLRHPFVLSLAAAASASETSEYVLALPSLVSYLTVVLITFCGIRSIFGLSAALFSGVFVASTPIFAITADAVMVEQMELALILLSLYLLWMAVNREQSFFVPLLAGVFAGLAFLTRETSGSYLLALGILFVLGIGPKRKTYLLAALGCAVVIFIDTCYFKYTTGEWLYRLKIITNHGVFTQITHNTQTVDLENLQISSKHLLPNIPRKDKGYSEYALININNIVNPYLMLFFHYSIGLTYWIGVAALFNIKNIVQQLATHQRSATFLIMLLIGAVVWFLAGTYIIGLRPHPRYWGLTTYTAAILGGLWCAWLWQSKHYVIVMLITLCVVIAHLLLIEMNESSKTSQRWLADYVQNTGHIVHTSSDEYVQGKVYFAQVRKVNDLILPLPDANAERIWVNEENPLPDEIKNNPDAWKKVWYRKSRTSWLGWLLDSIGLLNYFPPKFRKPLASPEANVALYRKR